MEIQKRNGVFGPDDISNLVLEKLDGLENETFVDSGLNTIAVLKRGMDQVYESVFQRVEKKQEGVLEERDSIIQDLYAQVEQHRKDGNFDAYEEALTQIGAASLHARDAVGKLKYIQARGFGEYDSKTQLNGMVRDLGRRLLPERTI